MIKYDRSCLINISTSPLAMKNPFPVNKIPVDIRSIIRSECEEMEKPSQLNDGANGRATNGKTEVCSEEMQTKEEIVESVERDTLTPNVDGVSIFSYY